VASGYIPLGPRPRQAVGALVVALVANLVAAVIDIGALPLLDDPTDLDALRQFDSVTRFATIIGLVSSIVAAICFIRWFNLVHRNLDALCPGLRRHATSWSIGGWFVPVLAFFRPKQILNDMLDCTHGAGTRPWWAATWWGVWIIGSLVSNLVGRAFFDADTIQSFRDATSADAVASLILIVAAALGVIVIRQVSGAMERKHAVATVPAVPEATVRPEPDGPATNPWLVGG
jgi:hypothetical protein